MIEYSELINQDHFDGIFELFQQIVLENALNEEHIKIIFELSKKSKFSEKTVELFWNLMELSVIGDQIHSIIHEKFIVLIKEETNKSFYIKKCIDRINANIQISASYSILKEIIDSYP